jgi:hypothetical protein
MKTKSVRLETKYIINAPLEEIYKIITDFENTPKYFPSVAKSARYISRQGNKFIVEAETKAFLGSKTFKVRMEGELRPGEGFISTNTSSLGVEHEVFSMKEIVGGTEIHYINDVEIKSIFFNYFRFFIKNVALWYWKRAVFEKLRKMLEN